MVNIDRKVILKEMNPDYTAKEAETEMEKEEVKLYQDHLFEKRRRIPLSNRQTNRSTHIQVGGRRGLFHFVFRKVSLIGGPGCGRTPNLIVIPVDLSYLKFTL